MTQSGPLLDEDLMKDVPEYEGVLKSFFQYLDQDFWALVAEQTNLYSVQQRDSLRSVNTTAVEMIRITGIQLMMGSLKLPQARLYWSRDFDFPIITNAVTQDRFFELRKYMHFVDNLSPHDENDKLWKIRPIIDRIRKMCVTLPRSAHLAIDEQMIPFSGRCQFRQYIPSKPNPLGLKNFVLAAKDGLVLDFHIYTGKGTVNENDLKQYGLGGSVVKLLTGTIPKDGGHVVYTDRFFTSIKCANFCLESNIHITGTVMKNRIGAVVNKLSSDKVMKRGEWDEKVREDDKMCCVKWKDNKSVILLSTCMGSEPTATCKRWSKEEKKRVDVPQPAIVKAYNQNMGGIDLCDRYLSYYRFYMRTIKWPVRAFNHFVDLTVVNCWIMYRRQCEKTNELKHKRMSLLNFRMHLATALIKFDSVTPPPPSRQSGRRQPQPDEEEVEEVEEDEQQPATKYRKVVAQPVDEVRFDMYGHFPKYCNDNFASKCRYPGCKSKSRIMCVKCNMYLCVLKNNCFQRYHMK